MNRRAHAFTGRGWLYATTAAIAGATTIWRAAAFGRAVERWIDAVAGAE